MSRIAYVNGRFVPQSQAAVNIEDRGYQFADGVYEVLHVHAGRFVDEDRHFARLERSLGEIRIDPPMSRVALRQVCRELVRRNRVEEGLLYMQITRGVARRDHAFPKGNVPPSLVMTVRRILAYPREVEAWVARAITWPDQRWARCDIKSTSLLPNVLARQAARERGAYEAILFDREGMVTEGAATSVWMVDADGGLRVRPLDWAILPGCTRAALLAEMSQAGIPFEERAFSIEELRGVREVFLTSASSFVKPVVAIDDKPVGDGAIGPVTRRLFALFARHVAAR